MYMAPLSFASLWPFCASCNGAPHSSASLVSNGHTKPKPKSQSKEAKRRFFSKGDNTKHQCWKSDKW
ncbi:hypothetical protein P8452_24767 [Trifolium repens]|nr:hypothetical protein P8452_24767 [Trifolium repens]